MTMSIDLQRASKGRRAYSPYDDSHFVAKRQRMFKRWKKGRKKLVGDIVGRARFKYAGGGVWSYFGARVQTVIDAQRHHRPLLFSS